MITLGKLAEQVHRLYNGGDPSDDSGITRTEIMHLVVQFLNNYLKIERFKANVPEGDWSVSNAVIAHYNGLLVSTYKDRSSVDMPAMPLSLPHGLGVWCVTPTDEPANPFVPIPSGAMGVIGTIPVLKDLGDLIGYEWQGTKLVFNKDITASPYNVTNVDLQLLICDIGEIGEWDYLPVPADAELDIITGVLKLLQAKGPMDNISDNVTRQ